MTVRPWFGSGHLCRSPPVPFALRSEHRQPESPSLLSVPIFKGIRKKIEPAIFSQVWKPPVFFFFSPFYAAFLARSGQMLEGQPWLFPFIFALNCCSVGMQPCFACLCPTRASSRAEGTAQQLCVFPAGRSSNPFTLQGWARKTAC